MNIKFIGTGSMISKDNQACYLINDNIMIDMPNGTVKHLRKIDKIDSVEHVFITHIHGDHYFDIPFLLLAKYKEGGQLTIHASLKSMWKIKKLVKMAFPREFYKIMMAKNIHYVSNKNECIIDNIKINRFNVVHGKMKPAFGYTFEINNKIITFTGDASLTNTILEKSAISQYMICDCTLKIGDEKHLGTDNIKMLLKNNKNLIIIPSHMGVNAKKILKEFKEKNLLIKEDMEDLEI